MAWCSSITKFSWSDVIWTTNRTQSRLVTSVWHGGAADSAKQNQTCNVRFSTPPLLGCPVMMSLLYCRFYMILKISSTWHRFLLCPCVNFQRRSHFWQTLSRGVLIILVNQTSPWEIFRVRICDSSQDCRYLWWTVFFFRVWCWKIYWWNPTTSSWSFGLCNAEFHCLVLYNVYSIFYFFKFNACFALFPLS